MGATTKVVHPASHFVPVPLDETVFVRGRGCIVEDDQGRTYIDCESGPGVVNVGHCHPKVMGALQAQLGEMTQSPGRYYTRPALTLVDRLAKLAPGRLNRTFICNSGAEANDGAVKLALKHAVQRGKKGFGILALEHSFHGRLSLPLALTGMADRKRGMGPYATFPGVVHVPAPYCYRCPLSYPSCGVACATAVEDAMKTKVPGEAAVFIGEPVMGVGGVIVPPDEYWPRVTDICRRHDVTVIFDEVFCGFGRTGKLFASEHWGQTPDLMSMAKGLGGGVPMAAFMATDEVANSFSPGDHFTTYGGNNLLGPTAALAVLDVMEEEHLVQNAAEVGAYFRDGLQVLAESFPQIGEVRSKGLFLGVELVKDRETKAPAVELTKQVQARLREKGVLVSITGVYKCVIRITPPLSIARTQVDQVVTAFRQTLEEVTGR
jgi:4-aminobutyrate aminotransferase-like enzyme